MKKIICITLVLTFVLAIFAGCGATKQTIVGSWSYQQKTILNFVTERTYTFNEDGTGTAPLLEGTVDVPMTYTLDGNTLTIKKGDIIDTLAGTETYTVQILGSKMTLTSTNGSTTIELTKK